MTTEITYSESELVETVSNEKMGIYIHIFRTIETRTTEGKARSRSHYKYAFKRDLRRPNDDGTARYGYYFFKKHAHELAVMLEETELHIAKLMLADKYE